MSLLLRVHVLLCIMAISHPVYARKTSSHKQQRYMRFRSPFEGLTVGFDVQYDKDLNQTVLKDLFGGQSQWYNNGDVGGRVCCSAIVSQWCYLGMRGRVNWRRYTGLSDQYAASLALETGISLLDVLIIYGIFGPQWAFCRMCPATTVPEEHRQDVQISSLKSRRMGFQGGYGIGIAITNSMHMRWEGLCARRTWRDGMSMRMYDCALSFMYTL